MRQRQSLWDLNDISKSIGNHKSIFFEPKEEPKFKFIVPDFYKASLSTGGLLIVSLTGSLLEGLDFSDDACRTIIQIGIPFHNLGDPKIIMKKEYIDKLKLIKQDENGLNGQTMVSFASQ